MAHDVKDIGRAQHGTGELRGNGLCLELKGGWNGDRLLRPEPARYYKLVSTVFNANSVWFDPGEDKVQLPLVYLSSISALP